MKRAPQGRYTREFRQEAVKLVLEENLSLPEAGRRLSLPPSTLGYWVKLYKAGKLGDVGKSYRPLTDVEMELARTKKLILSSLLLRRPALRVVISFLLRLCQDLFHVGHYLGTILSINIIPSLDEVGWEKWTPKSDKLERRRCQDEEGPARKVYQGIPAGSSEAGIGRESVIARGRASVVLTAIDVGVLGEAI